MRWTSAIEQACCCFNDGSEANLLATAPSVRPERYPYDKIHSQDTAKVAMSAKEEKSDRHP
jgi:hypothetical protein